MSTEELKEKILDIELIDHVVANTPIRKVRSVLGNNELDKIIQLFTSYHQQQLEQAVREARIAELIRLHRFEGEGLSPRDYDNATDELIDERIAELQSTKEDKSNG